jgi:hypothetical protein
MNASDKKQQCSIASLPDVRGSTCFRTKFILRSAIRILPALLLMAVPACAKTFQFTYTSGVLTRSHGIHPSPGAKQLAFVITSRKPFPKNTCFDVPLSEVTSYTDGVDSIETLTAAGYTLDQDSFLSLCSDASGRHIMTWQISYNFSEPSQYPNYPNNYSAQSNFPKYAGFYDTAFFLIGDYNRYKEDLMQNVTGSGTWKYRVLR